MKKSSRILALLLCMVLILSGMAPAAQAGSAQLSTADGQTAVKPELVDAVSMDGVDNVVAFEGGQWVLSELEDGGASSVQFDPADDTFYGPDDVVEVIVVLEDEPLLKSAAEVGLSADMPAYLATAQGAALERSLLSSHDLVRAEIASLCGEVEAVSPQSYDYTAVLNGFSTDVPYGKIGEIEALPGVKRVSLVTYYSVPEDQSSYDIAMNSSTGMIGADEVFQNMSFAGHDGAGAIVAILDTGLDTDHEAFSVMPETVRYTRDDVQQMMSGATLSSGVTDAGETYVNAKVPYAYDYANVDNNVNGDHPHGVHVAGTVAGNNGSTFHGVAPNAQLMIMKVFADGSGSTSDAIINAGLDDAVKLGADSINMSLGSAAGFTYDRETEEEVYNNCWDAGINLMVAAGNDTNSSVGSQYGNSLPFADSLDNGIVGSPSTSYGAMSVASMQNSMVEMDYFLLGEEKIGFSQMVYAPNSSYGNFYNMLRNWSDTSNVYTNEYVVVPNLGAEADYEGLEVTGKLVLVQRGVTNFEEKAAIAKAQGAVGVIIYNNAAGGIAPAYNTYTLPMVGISQADGERLIAAETKTVRFGPASVNDFHWETPDAEKLPWRALLPASDAGQVSGFSSIGPAPDLGIKPEIAAPGGNIVSSVIGGGYEAMSGTSMATPHMAGAAAVVRNYARSKLGITDADALRDITDALLMSTAVPGRNGSGVEYAPRWQGAGMVNVKNAVTSAAYLTVDSNAAGVAMTRPKAELGSSSTGTFPFSFKVHNLTSEPVSYTLSAVSLSEGVLTQGGLNFSDGVAQRLEAGTDFTAGFSGEGIDGNTLTVAANGVATVNVTLALTGSYMDELWASFPNGNYVEGYVYLQPADGVTLVLPYLGFCGDWADAGTVFEGGPSSAWLLQPTYFATANASGAGLYLAEDPMTDPVRFNYDRLAFSPTIAGAQQYLATILTTRRNLTDFEMYIANGEGEKVWSLTADYLRKSYAYASMLGLMISNVQVIAEGWTGRAYNEDSGQYDGEFLPAGQYYDYVFTGKTAQSEHVETVTHKVWLDAGAPEVSELQCYRDADDGKFKLSFKVRDDHYVRMVELIDSTATYGLTYTVEDFATLEPQGATSLVVMDLDELCAFLADNGLNPGRVKLAVSDYSLNTGSVYVDLGPQYMSLANATIAVGDSQQMQLRILPARLADSVKLTWSSSDESVATVDQTGLVTGVAKGGCVVSVTAESGLTASAAVTIGDETLPPTEPETPDPDVHVDLPSGEAFPDVWDTRVAASDTELLGQKFEHEGFWYKITGADTVQLIKNPNVANAYSATYPDAPAALVIPETVAHDGKDYTVTTIGANAFYYCSQLTSVTLPETIRVIGDYAFMLGWGNSSLASVNLPEGLEEIGNSAFYNNKLCDFRLPQSLRYIGASAFTGTGITELRFGDAIESVGTRAFENCAALAYAELPLVAEQTEGLFMNCSALAEVDIAPGVTMIPENGFYNCTSLTSVELPDSVKELRAGAFYGAGLDDLYLEGKNVTTIGDFAYAGLINCYDFIIPDSVTYVGARAFYWCRYVRSIEFGENVAYVGDEVMSSFFIHPDVERVVPEVKSANAGAAVRRSGYVGQMTRDGVPFDVYTGAPFILDGLTYMPISADEVSVINFDEGLVSNIIRIPEKVVCEGDETEYTVTGVGDRLFFKKYGITEIHLPDTIKTVGERAFDQVNALEYINIPKSLTTLSGRQAFGYGGWDNLVWSGVWNPETLVVPAALKTWNECAFSGNKYTAAVLSEGLEMVGAYGLSNNMELADVQMAGSVKYLKNNAFSDCPALTSIELPEGLLYIGDQAFQNDPLERVTLPDSLKYIGTKAFDAYKYDYNTPYPYVKTYVGVKEVSIPGGVAGLGWNAFDSSVAVTTVLGSQRNLVAERCDMESPAAVVWDGRTDIPAGDYSVIPAGVTVTVSRNVRVDGELVVDGELIIPDPYYVIGDRGNISGEGKISPEYRIVDRVPTPIVIPPAPTPTDPGDGEALQFTDLVPGAWYEEAVRYVIENGLMNGVSDTSFAPNAAMTRAMLVTVLYRIEGKPAVSGDCAFTDVKAGSYYEQAVVWASANGIVNGVSDTLFDPDSPVTRQQAAAIFFRYAGWKGMDTSASDDLSAFTDTAEVADWALPAMRWAVACGVINGVDEGILAPGLATTRAQVAQLLLNFSRLN